MEFVQEKNNGVVIVEAEEQEEKLFDPPLYKQRYSAVADIINQYHAKTVVDIGCAEGQFLNQVKEFCSSVEEIIGVDVNEHLLERNVFRLKPLTYEFLIKRKIPLKMAFYCGSIANADSRFCGVDVVSCIECIEHLHENILLQVPHSIFGKLQPKIVVITTPNSEYNVLFKNFNGMRHTDHKFEWTRDQFRNWCEAIVQNYTYQVTYTGVGDPKDGYDVGFCSQIAIFTQEEMIDKSSTIRSSCSDRYDEPGVQSYKLVFEVEYPFENLNENRSEKIFHEVEYLIYHLYLPNIINEEEDCKGEVIAVPIDKLLTYRCLEKFNIDKHEMICLFNQPFQGKDGKDGKLSLSNDKEHILVSPCYCDSDNESDFENEPNFEPAVGNDNLEIEEEDWD